MGPIRLRGRRPGAVAAGAAAMLITLGSAAYALGVPDLPDLGNGVELEVPSLDLPQPLVPPPEVELPKPVVGPPDDLPDPGDEIGSLLDGLTEDLSPAGAGRRPATRGHDAPEPDITAPHPAVPDSGSGFDPDADPESVIDRALEQCGGSAADAAACDWTEWGLGGWDDLGGHGGRVRVGDGLSAGNGDNITVHVDVGSEGNTGTVDQRNG